MGEEKPSSGPTEAAPVGTAAASPGLEGVTPTRPRGWMYKGIKIGRSEIWYASPKFQLFMVAFVCFLCPGMFNALTGLGGGGQLDHRPADNANTALYSTFAVVGFFAGTVANTLGLRITMAIGGLGYCIYAASLLSYTHTKNEGFVVFSGAFLGVCAGLLWTGQGAIMMSYPPEDSKGRFISWFWMIFNLGAVLGSLVPLVQNINATTAGTVNDGTYIGFIVLMFIGALISLCLCNADKIQREDGSRVILMKNPSWKTEFLGLWQTLIDMPYVLALFPIFASSNTFYTYHLNNFNGAHFDLRTRSLNGLLYWTSQIIGSAIVGYALDLQAVRRSVRARAALVGLFCLTMIIWGCGWIWQAKQDPRELVEAEPSTSYRYDWTDGGERYIGPMFLFMFYGAFDAAWQTCMYWYMGALSNNSRKAANLAGFYKGLQSAGAAIFWRMDALGKSYDAIFGASWGVLAVSLVIAAPILWTKIQDTVLIEEDLKFSDENYEDVAPTVDRLDKGVV